MVKEERIKFDSKINTIHYNINNILTTKNETNRDLSPNALLTLKDPISWQHQKILESNRTGYTLSAISEKNQKRSF